MREETLAGWALPIAGLERSLAQDSRATRRVH